MVNEANRDGVVTAVILVASIAVFPVQAFAGETLHSVSESQYKAAAIMLDLSRLYLTLAGACLAFFISNGKNVVALTRTEGRFFSKAACLLSVFLLLTSVFVQIWDTATVANQLRNDFLNLADLSPEILSLGTLCVGILTFSFAAFGIWEVQHEANN